MPYGIFRQSLVSSQVRRKTKKGEVKSHTLTFVHLGTFIHHLSKLSGLSKRDVKESLTKTFANECVAEVIVSPEKPVVLNFKVSTNICTLKCHFQTKNKFGNVTSF